MKGKLRRRILWQGTLWEYIKAALTPYILRSPYGFPRHWELYIPGILAMARRDGRGRIDWQWGLLLYFPEVNGPQAPIVKGLRLWIGDGRIFLYRGMETILRLPFGPGRT